MHTKAHAHSHLFGVDLNPAKVTLAALLTLLFLIFLIMNIIAVPAQAQNSVPPTARQAANMPQYAARLAHGVQPASPYNASPVARPTEPHASWKNPADPRARTRGSGPLDANEIYDNGPINGTTDAWTINSGFVVSDTFTVSSGGGTVNGLTFGAWLEPGDVLQTVEISITSSEFGGTSYTDQVINFTQSGCSGNQYGFNICTETSANFTGLNLAAGTYWVNLSNAVVNTGDPIYWDENSGVGCQSPGCPSEASENSVGTIPSEAFTILGNATTTTTTTSISSSCPGPQNGFHDLYDFPAGSGPSGVAIGGAGKLYGTIVSGGRDGAGLLYDLTQRTGQWLLSSLYSFLGGADGSGPSSVVIGPRGALFGSAQSDIQGCGYLEDCGLIYEAQPSPTVCATALCGWNETTIYQFTGSTDAWGGVVSAFDSAGNLYGISGYGGAYGQGAVFELTPSQGSWTEKILYSFTGGSDGGGPNSLLLGQDGNLYGTAGRGGNNGCYEGGPCGVVFQLVPSGGGWTENVIYAFTGSPEDGWGPGGLIQNEMGGLIGFSICNTVGPGRCYPGGEEYGGMIFGLGRNGGGWQFGQISQYRGEVCDGSDFVTYNALALDGAGNLYAVDGGGLYHLCGAVLNITSQTSLVSGYTPIFGNLTSDADGNLYGTTSSCGFGTFSRTDGMVWQYSP